LFIQKIVIFHIRQNLSISTVNLLAVIAYFPKS